MVSTHTGDVELAILNYCLGIDTYRIDVFRRRTDIEKVNEMSVGLEIVELDRVIVSIYPLVAAVNEDDRRVVVMLIELESKV